jgi:hypothetical protein
MGIMKKTRSAIGLSADVEGQVKQLQLEQVERKRSEAVRNFQHYLAMPALIKTHPPPVGKIMGDLSDMEKVASFIGYGSKMTQDSSRNQGEMT